MANDTLPSGPSQWDPGPIFDWLLAEGRFLSGVEPMIEQMGQRMAAAGAPLWRLRLSMRTLHPLLAAVSAVWERDKEGATSIQTPHGLEGRSGYIGSPLEIIGRTDKPFRRRLYEGLSDQDHNVLHDLKARGGTDYYGLPMRFSDGSAGSVVFVTDRQGGFSGPDIAGFDRLTSAVAPIVEVFSVRQMSTTVAEAYLGPRTGRRVMSGQITRGDVETITAAVLVSDIRDWTGLNNRLSGEAALALANRYFEIIAEAVEAHEGEILKLIGDGVLALFPTEATGHSACANALAAARQALRAAQGGDAPPELQFGIGMHFGDVLYGNIGSTSRLDFTVLGQTVNVAARIEGLCGKLGQPILFSQDFANRLDEPAAVVANEQLKGLKGDVPILSPAGEHA